MAGGGRWSQAVAGGGRRWQGGQEGVGSACRGVVCVWREGGEPWTVMVVVAAVVAVVAMVDAGDGC